MSDAATHDAEFQGSFFSLQLDGVEIAYFTGCSGLSLEYEVVNYKQTDGKQLLSRKRPGRPKYSEVVLKRGFSADTKLYDWFNEVVDAAKPTPYKTASIVIMDREGKEGARFSLEAFWPSKMSVSDLKAGSDDVMVEELTIQHELLDWV
jgi:phage tail-like protein